MSESKQTLEDCYGADFWDMESGVLKEGFLLLTLNEKEYYFLERPVFCAVDDKFDLFIGWGETEWIEDQALDYALEITNKFILEAAKTSDDEAVRAGKRFRFMLEKAIEYKTCVLCYF